MSLQVGRVQWGDGPHGPNKVTPYFEHPIVWEAS
jgi:hypothetical protein